MTRPQDRAAAVLIEDGRVLLIERIKPHDHYYVVPGGKVESGETPQQAAVREAMEEVNLEIAIGGLLLKFSDADRHQYFFSATRISGEVQLGDGPEARRAGADNQYIPLWLPLKDLDEHDVRPHEARKIFSGYTKG